VELLARVLFLLLLAAVAFLIDVLFAVGGAFALVADFFAVTAGFFPVWGDAAMPTATGAVPANKEPSKIAILTLAQLLNSTSLIL
jgi:hypothetical protein